MQKQDTHHAQPFIAHEGANRQIIDNITIKARSEDSNNCVTSLFIKYIVLTNTSVKF